MYDGTCLHCHWPHHPNDGGINCKNCGKRWDAESVPVSSPLPPATTTLDVDVLVTTLNWLCDNPVHAIVSTNDQKHLRTLAAALPSLVSASSRVAELEQENAVSDALLKASNQAVLSAESRLAHLSEKVEATIRAVPAEAFVDSIGQPCPSKHKDATRLVTHGSVVAAVLRLLASDPGKGA